MLAYRYGLRASEMSVRPCTGVDHAAEEAARSAKKRLWRQGETYESPRAYRKRVGIS